jgi:hypothetical protein
MAPAQFFGTVPHRSLAAWRTLVFLDVKGRLAAVLLDLIESRDVLDHVLVHDQHLLVPGTTFAAPLKNAILLTGRTRLSSSEDVPLCCPIHGRKNSRAQIHCQVTV